MSAGFGRGHRPRKRIVVLHPIEIRRRESIRRSKGSDSRSVVDVEKRYIQSKPATLSTPVVEFQVFWVYGGPGFSPAVSIGNDEGFSP